MHFHESSDSKYAEKMHQVAPKTIDALMNFNQAVFEETDSSLDRRTKELIAVAVAATTQCPYCIDMHVRAAHEAGADEAQVAAAVMISSLLRAGGSFSHGWMAMKIMEDAT